MKLMLLAFEVRDDEVAGLKQLLDTTIKEDSTVVITASDSKDAALDVHIYPKQVSK